MPTTTKTMKRRGCLNEVVLALLCFGCMTQSLSAFSVQPFAPQRSLTKNIPSTRISSNDAFSSRTKLFSTKSKTDSDKEVCLPCEDEYVNVAYENYSVQSKPGSAVQLGLDNFLRQGATLIEDIAKMMGLIEKDPYALPGSLCLRLSNEAVKAAEEQRIAEGKGVDANPVSQWLYDVGCFFLDELFDERPIQRFWFLETIARIPYFSYITMLHFYESLGWWRGVELRRVHNAQEWNELHHLLIMESLGGNREWFDRFLGYHVAIGYYWFLVGVFLFSPRIAYQFMELLEAHAVDTYGTFVRENRDRLKRLSPPIVAQSYYSTGDLFFFDDFQIDRPPGTRRPPCDNLLDVFENIATDEATHVRVMQACQDYASEGIEVVSPHLSYSEEQKLTAEKKRQYWKEWSDTINNQEAETPTEMSGY